MDVSEAADQGRAVQRLEFVQFAAVDEARHDLAHVIGLAIVGRHHAAKLVRVMEGIGGLAERHFGRLDTVQVGDDAPGDAKRVGVVLGPVIGDARDAGVDLGAAQVLGADHLAGGRLHQGRPAEEDGAHTGDDDALVRHRRDVGAAAVHEPMTAAIWGMPAADMTAWL